MQKIKNHITLIGNMGGDAQITNFDNGGKVARFKLATTKYSSKNKNTSTDWHRVFAWGNLAGFIEQYGKKGKQLAVHGRLVSRTYLNKDGKRLRVTEVEVKHVIGL